MPHPPYLSDSGPSNFFCVFPWMKKVLRGKHFADVAEVKPRTAEALKGIRIDEFKDWFWAVEKNVSIGVLHQIENALKATEV